MFQIRLITPGELVDVQRLRATVYGAEGLEDPSNFVDGRYIDTNDPWSFNLGAFTGAKRIVGTFKVTPRLAGRPLKLESDVPAEVLAIEPDARCVETARLAVLAPFRNLGVALGLWQAAYRLIVMGRYEMIYAFQREETLVSQERMGLPVERLNGQIVGQYNLLLTPTRTPTAAVLPSLIRANPAMAYLFSQPLPDGMFDPRTALKPPPAELETFLARHVPASPAQLPIAS